MKRFSNNILIILDRDGVINHESVEYVKSPEEWIPIDGSLEAIARLNKAGHTVVVATNQSGVGRGHYSLETMHKIHEHMQLALVHVGGCVEHVYFCPHHPDDHCDCRKPKPGLLLEIAEDYPDLFNDAIFIGDSLRDIHAAQAVEIRPMLVRTGNGEATVAAGEGPEGVPIFNDLAAAVEDILT